MRKTVLFLLPIMIIFVTCERNRNPLSADLNKRVYFNDGSGYDVHAVDGKMCHIYFEIEKDKINNLGWKSSPDSIQESAHSYVKDSFGEDYLKNYMSLIASERIPEDVRSDAGNDVYVSQYNYKIVIGDYSTFCTVSVTLDSFGTVIDDYGITDRVSHPEFGMPFSIGWIDAVKIAMEENLDFGIVPWEAKFYYHTEQYVWRIRTFFSEKNGEDLLIYASSGEIAVRAKFTRFITYR